MSGILEKIASKVLPDRIEKILFNEETKEKLDFALDFVDGAKNFEPEIDALAVALKNLTGKMKDAAIASPAKWDDKYAIWVDSTVEKIIAFLKGAKLF